MNSFPTLLSNTEGRFQHRVTLTIKSICLFFLKDKMIYLIAPFDKEMYRSTHEMDGDSILVIFDDEVIVLFIRSRIPPDEGNH